MRRVGYIGVHVAFPTIGLALLLVTAACGDGPDAERTDGGSEVGAAAGGGSATLTVGERTYEFDRARCAFGPEETRRDDTEFVLSAIQNGLQLDATINTRFGHSVSLDDIEDFENPSVGWSAGGPGSGLQGAAGEIIQVDGKRVSVRTTFTDEVSGDTAEGSLSAVCP